MPTSLRSDLHLSARDNEAIFDRNRGPLSPEYAAANKVVFCTEEGESSTLCGASGVDPSFVGATGQRLRR